MPDETGHKITIQELPGVWQRSEPLLEARCSCGGWKIDRDFRPREVAEAAARRHLQAAKRPAQD